MTIAYQVVATYAVISVAVSAILILGGTLSYFRIARPTEGRSVQCSTAGCDRAAHPCYGSRCEDCYAENSYGETNTQANAFNVARASIVGDRRSGRNRPPSPGGPRTDSKNEGNNE